MDPSLRLLGLNLAKFRFFFPNHFAVSSTPRKINSSNLKMDGTGKMIFPFPGGHFWGFHVNLAGCILLFLMDQLF